MFRQWFILVALKYVSCTTEEERQEVIRQYGTRWMDEIPYITEDLWADYREHGYITI